MKLWHRLTRPHPVVSVLRLEGAIGMGTRGLTDARLAGRIEKAFRAEPVAVALQVNSPGGSPVQSSLIAARIRRLSEEHDIPVFAFVEDVAASGGYWLACAADEIYVDRTSLLGSIGVISAGFGLDEAIARYGVERRVHTAGESKSFMDPFRPENEDDVRRLKSMLDQMHEVFIDEVTTRRKDRLDRSQPLFTGEVWVGQKAIDVGLADGIGHLGPEMKRRFGEKLRFKVLRGRRPLIRRFGMSIMADALDLLRERAAFGRFGL